MDIFLLKQLGADEKTIEFIRDNLNKNLIPARVITQYSSIYEVALSPTNSVLALLPGNYKRRMNSVEIPVVGDWVFLENKKSDKLPIKQLIPRKSLISRNHPYKGIQPISANIDYLFLTFSLDPKNFEIERIKYYLKLNRSENIKTYILLNKMDLVQKDINEILLEIEKAINFPRELIIPLDSLNMIGYERIKSILTPFQTSTLIGPSGVGKSTIINNLYGKKILKTFEVNRKSYKGRHTTTTRKIIILQNDHIIIDTPGISLVAEEIIDIKEFSDIFEYAKECKFSDCLHLEEPNCNVKKMLNEGRLNKEVYDKYIQIIKRYA